MQKFLLILLSITLAGCATHISQEALSEASACPVATVTFDPAKIWPLKIKGTYLQKITASVDGKKFSFSVHLTLTDEYLEAIGFSDIAGRLYYLKWSSLASQPSNVTWEKSPRIPDFIQPESIIADFLFINMPANQLQSALQGTHVDEKREGLNQTRIVTFNNGILRKITYSKPMDGMWGQVKIDNPFSGYQLDIQTVRQ